MPIIKAKTNVDVYRIRAQAGDIHELSGRNDHAMTCQVNERIVQQLNPERNDCVADIGCGDGSLLAAIADSIRLGVGFAPTREEVDRLARERKSLSNVEFRVGLSTSLPFDSGIADKIICNGVLILLQDDREVEHSLREIHRIAKESALIWVGEVPDVDENWFYSRMYGDSIARWLIYSWRKHGFRAFVRALRRVMWSLFGRETLIIAPKNLWHMAPDQLIRMAEREGLRLISHERHQTIDASGRSVPSLTRYNYLFMKKHSE